MHYQPPSYIHNPPFFQKTELQPTAITKLENAYCLLNLADSITTDHISPAGKITKNSPAGRYLVERGVNPKDFNSYGSRRGNDEVMARGTFANIRLINKLAGKTGPQTMYVPSGDIMDVFDAANRYQAEGHSTIIMAGAEYGSGRRRNSTIIMAGAEYGSGRPGGFMKICDYRKYSVNEWRCAPSSDGWLSWWQCCVVLGCSSGPRLERPCVRPQTC